MKGGALSLYKFASSSVGGLISTGTVLKRGKNNSWDEKAARVANDNRSPFQLVLFSFCTCNSTILFYIRT